MNMMSIWSIGVKLVNLGLILLLVSVLDCCTSNSTAPKNSDAKSDICNVSDPVQVGVYFESLCPDSKRFFLKQLLPTYNDISSIMKINLVAFGHARVLGPNKMVCQHGARECENNKLMACIATQSGVSEKSVLETIGCVFESKMTPEKCVDRYLIGVQFSQIEQCKNSDASERLMIAYETETGKPNYIPHLTLNGEHSDDIQHGLEFNLKRYVCEHFNGTKPDGCKNLPEIKREFLR